MKMKTLYIWLIIILLISSVHADVFYTDGIETHVDVGSVVIVPAHFNRPGFGYSINVVMRPAYARYFVDSFEDLNLGLSFQSTTQYINSDFAYRDFCVIVRYYFNRSPVRAMWQSTFIGAGIGIANIYWDVGDGINSKKDTDYIVEAGYEFDLFSKAVMSIVANFRIVDIEPVSYTGAGFIVTLGLALE